MQTAIIVGLDTIDEENIDYSLLELENLAKECDIKVINKMKQKGKINPKTYIGSGKLEELLVEIALDNPDYVIFNDELSPLMLKNLNEEIPCEVRDRSLIILDIFLRHAKTTEAKLEIELAHLKYLLPRLSSLRDGFDRQGGVGSKGPGETQLELDRRKVSNDIVKLERELAELHKMKMNQIEHRKKNEIKTVALVGYTNAGKSSMMNALIKYIDENNNKTVDAKDQLFATLTTNVRRLEYNNIEFLLTDTVGFVSKLPTHLVHSFNQTLAEVKEADLILHVLDVSTNYTMNQFQVTNDVLHYLGVDDSKIIHLFNKVDLVNEDWSRLEKNYIPVSAKSGYHIKEVLDRINKFLVSEYVSMSLDIPYTDPKILNFIISNTNVISKVYEDDRIHMEVLCPVRYVKRLNQYESDNNVN